MQETGCKENYPGGWYLVSTFLSLLIYGIGVYILLQFGIIWVAAYLIFILILEFRLISRHCTDCYYYGKTCAFGKGRLTPCFSKRAARRGFPQ